MSDRVAGSGWREDRIKGRGEGEGPVRPRKSAASCSSVDLADRDVDVFGNRETARRGRDEQREREREREREKRGERKGKRRKVRGERRFARELDNWSFQFLALIRRMPLPPERQPRTGTTGLLYSVRSVTRPKGHGPRHRLRVLNADTPRDRSIGRANRVTRSRVVEEDGLRPRIGEAVTSADLRRRRRPHGAIRDE